MAGRLGNLIYWAACAAAVLWTLFALYAGTSGVARPEWNVILPLAAIGAVVIWGAGRAARYVLAGK